MLTITAAYLIIIVILVQVIEGISVSSPAIKFSMDARKKSTKGSSISQRIYLSTQQSLRRTTDVVLPLITVQSRSKSGRRKFDTRRFRYIDNHHVGADVNLEPETSTSNPRTRERVSRKLKDDTKSFNKTNSDPFDNSATGTLLSTFSPTSSATSPISTATTTSTPNPTMDPTSETSSLKALSFPTISATESLHPTRTPVVLVAVPSVMITSQPVTYPPSTPLVTTTGTPTFTRQATIAPTTNEPTTAAPLTLLPTTARPVVVTATPTIQPTTLRPVVIPSTLMPLVSSPPPATAITVAPVLSTTTMTPILVPDSTKSPTKGPSVPTQNPTMDYFKDLPDEWWMPPPVSGEPPTWAAPVVSMPTTPLGAPVTLDTSLSRTQNIFDKARNLTTIQLSDFAIEMKVTAASSTSSRANGDGSKIKNKIDNKGYIVNMTALTWVLEAYLFDEMIFPNLYDVVLPKPEETQIPTNNGQGGMIVQAKYGGGIVAFASKLLKNGTMALTSIPTPSTSSVRMEQGYLLMDFRRLQDYFDTKLGYKTGNSTNSDNTPGRIFVIQATMGAIQSDVDQKSDESETNTGEVDTATVNNNKSLGTIAGVIGFISLGMILLAIWIIRRKLQRRRQQQQQQKQQQQFILHKLEERELKAVVDGSSRPMASIVDSNSNHSQNLAIDVPINNNNRIEMKQTMEVEKVRTIVTEKRRLNTILNIQSRKSSSRSAAGKLNRVTEIPQTIHSINIAGPKDGNSPNHHPSTNGVTILYDDQRQAITFNSYPPRTIKDGPKIGACTGSRTNLVMTTNAGGEGVSGNGNGGSSNIPRKLKLPVLPIPSFVSISYCPEAVSDDDLTTEGAGGLDIQATSIDGQKNCEMDVQITAPASQSTPDVNTLIAPIGNGSANTDSVPCAAEINTGTAMENTPNRRKNLS